LFPHSVSFRYNLVHITQDITGARVTDMISLPGEGLGYVWIFLRSEYVSMIIDISIKSKFDVECDVECDMEYIAARAKEYKIFLSKSSEIWNIPHVPATMLMLYLLRLHHQIITLTLPGKGLFYTHTGTGRCPQAW
jgi:hypothetical protein